MSLYHGLFVRDTNSTPAGGANTLNANCSEGLFSTPLANGDGPLVYVPETAVLLTVAGVSLEKVGILQISPAGVVTVKYGASVAAGSGLAQYPAPDADHFMLAKLFTPAAPITHTTAAVANANINNLVLDAEFGGR